MCYLAVNIHLVIPIEDKQIYSMENTVWIEYHKVSYALSCFTCLSLCLSVRVSCLPVSFSNSIPQSWGKCVGTLESNLPLLCATDKWNVSADINKYCTWGSSLYDTISLPFPHQTILGDLTSDLTTWSQSTLYKGEGWWFQWMVLKCLDFFFQDKGCVILNMHLVVNNLWDSMQRQTTEE